MKKPILFIIVATLIGCASGPVFNSHADHEEGSDTPCANGKGGFVAGYHKCQFDKEEYACCPDGYSCSVDDFIPHYPNACRWWGLTGR